MAMVLAARSRKTEPPMHRRDPIPVPLRRHGGAHIVTAASGFVKRESAVADRTDDGRAE